VNGQPDVQLLKSGLKPRFQIDEKSPILLCVLGVNKDAIEPVDVVDSSGAPDALDDLRFPRNSTESVLNFGGSFRETIPEALAARH